jgi:L-ribulose-5-phosphate 3-epimerase
MSLPLGFMQGRLCALVGGRIQAFPWDEWELEFPRAQALGLHLMEWTLDQDRLRQNPLLTEAGQSRIRALGQQHGLAVASLTGDCFMQAPFWKVAGAGREALQTDFMDVVAACGAVGISMIVVPLVDNGALADRGQEDLLVDFLLARRADFRRHGVAVLFECDFAPQELGRFIGRLPPGDFGVNYDIGNSAALGFDPNEEFACFGTRIQNVHVKDRVLGGTTVPLGTGNADFQTVFAQLARVQYGGNYIMQTARASDGEHAAALRRYMDMIRSWVRT